MSWFKRQAVVWLVSRCVFCHLIVYVRFPVSVELTHVSVASEGQSEFFFRLLKSYLYFFSLKQKRSSYFVLRRINFQAYGDLDKRVTVVFLDLHICKLLRLRIRG